MLFEFMSIGVNKVILMGSVGATPVVRKTSQGVPVVSFSLATSKSWTDKTTNERKTSTEWHRICIYGSSLCNIIEKRCVDKGTRLYLEGSLRCRKWVDPSDNSQRYTVEVVLQGFDCTMRVISHSRPRMEDEERGRYRDENSEDNPHDVVEEDFINEDSQDGSAEDDEVF